MPPNESPSVSVLPRVPSSARSDAPRTVVWSGEHDASTCVRLSLTLADAAGRDDADIIVDLSGVTFMDASTIGTLVVARNRLRGLSRSLYVRNPSPQARRLLDLCGLAQPIDESAAPTQQFRAPP